MREPFLPLRRAARLASRLGASTCAVLGALGLSCLSAPRAAWAAAFTPGNVVVYRTGDGVTALANTGSPVFLDEFAPAGGAPVQSLALPTAASGNNNPLIASGGANSEGLLSRSTDGNFLVLTGYGRALGGSGSLAGTASATVPRTVGRVSAAGVIDTTTALTDFASGNNPRSAASVDGTSFYLGGGAGGVRLASIGATTSTDLTGAALTNTRQIGIFGGQLYASSNSGTNTTRGVNAIGSGLPTTSGQSVTRLPGLNDTNSASTYSFVLLDLDATVAGLDTLYVADDSIGLQKFSLVGGTFTSNGTVGQGTDAYRGLTSTVSGTTVTLFATRGGNQLVRLSDASGYNGAFAGTPTLLATAGANTAFRGVALAPGNVVVEQPDLTASVSAPANAVVNTAYSYTITVTNNGTAATNISARFNLPTGVTFNSATGDSGFTGANAAGVVTFSGGSLGAGSTATLTVSVTPTSVGTVNSAPGSAQADSAGTITESNEANNDSTENLDTVVAAAANTAPTITASSPSPFLIIAPTGESRVSGVILDPTDPARTFGIAFALADAESAAGALTFTVAAQPVANQANAAPTFEVTGSGASRLLKITPTAVGFSDITVSVSDGALSSTYLVRYAASAASATPATTRFHTSASDASTAIGIGAGFMFVADDDDQKLRLFSRTQSGLPVNAFDFTASLGLTDISGGTPREVDIESSARVGNRIYWLGSQSNSSGGANRPNRTRLFTTDLSGAGDTATLAFVGRYDFLRQDLLAWDSSNAHGKGANFYGFADSAKVNPNGKIPEAPDGSGFNLEGLAFKPGSTSIAYLAFRAPIVPATARTRALIVPVLNFGTLAISGAAAGTTQFGAPIELDLGGRGIRSLDSNGTEMLIVAGPPASATATVDFRLYTWSGNPADAPRLREANLAGLNPEGIVELPAGALGASTSVQLVSDNGDDVFYANGTIAKDLPDAFSKFRTDIVSLGASVTLAPDTATTPEDVPVTISVLANDVADAPVVTAVTNGANGTVAIIDGGTRVRYTPNLNFNGADAFTYTVSDGGVQRTANVSVTITPVNDAPVVDLNGPSVGTDFAAIFTEDGGAVSIVAPELGVSDVDSAVIESATATITNRPDGALEILSVDTAGTAIAVSFNPATGLLSLSGSDSLARYQAVLRTLKYLNASQNPNTTPRIISVSVRDTDVQSAVATGTVQVLAVNDAPVADAQSTSLNANASRIITLSGSDIEDAALSFRIVDGPSNGTLSGSGATRTYTPNANFVGTDSFTFVASDGGADSAPATVTLQVLASGTPAPPNSEPVAVADSYTVVTSPLQVLAVDGVLKNDTDADGDALQAILAQAPAHGSVVLRADGSFTYTPAVTYSGPDAFFYVALDAAGQSAPARVSLQVAASAVVDNTPPLVALAGANSRTLRGLPLARGSAVDRYAVAGRGIVAMSGLKSVVIRLQNARGQFFNGRLFQAAPFDLATRQVGRSFFELARPLPSVVPDGRYTFTAIAIDNANNVARATQTVFVDATPPIITISTPAAVGASNAARVSRLSSIAGRAVGAAFVSVFLQRADGQYFNGREFQSAPAVIPVQKNATSYSVPASALPVALLTPGRYLITVRASDEARNPTSATRVVIIESAPAR
jgi:hypothetical protein